LATGSRSTARNGPRTSGIIASATIPAATSTAIPSAFRATAPAGDGPGGATEISPTSLPISTTSTAATNGSAVPSTAISDRSNGYPRRAARAHASTVVSSTGTISVSTNSEIAQPGMTLPSNRTNELGAATVGAESSAEIDSSTARPVLANAGSRTIRAAADGPRSPDSDSVTAGTPARANGPWPEIVNGKARWAS